MKIHALSLATAATASLVSAGCLLSPTDDGIVDNTAAPLPFNGFLLEANAPVYVRAWNHLTHQMEDVGAPVRSGDLAYTVSGGPLYSWETSRALPAAYWRTGPGGGQCAMIGAQTISGGARYNAITAEEDWANCWWANDSVGAFNSNCKSDHSPAARIYSASWGAVTVNQSVLNLAGAIASSQISLVFDNHTPIQGQFCNAGNPGGCPPGLSADPETYQFFQPNASHITQTGQPALDFSITPTRSPPMTVYIDDLRSRTLRFSTSGDRFTLTIDFEADGPELRMNCIRDFRCFLYPSSMELDTPRAVISFGLQLAAGRVTYSDATATFTTSSTDDNARSAATAIGAAMADKLNNEPSIKAAVAAALDSVIRQTANLGNLTMDGLTVGGGVVRVRPGCAGA
jgi:hypothetical protein